MKCTGFMRFGVIKFNTERKKNIYIHTHDKEEKREMERANGIQCKPDSQSERESENKIRQCEREKKMCDVCKA